MRYRHTHTHTGNYLAMRIKDICENMDGSWGHYTEWSKSEKDKYCMILLICGCKLTAGKNRMYLPGV